MGNLEPGHQTALELRKLVPEALTGGGSFALMLPHPGTLAAEDRASVFESAQKAAVAQCLKALLARAGLPEDTRVMSGDGGQRIWPPGFVGSLTHKGTVVLGVIAGSEKVPMIGLDLERLDRTLSEIEEMVAPEGLPPGLDVERGRLMAFSAKEAVFKAQYPVTHEILDFSDVRLVWERGEGDVMIARALCPVAGLSVRAIFVDEWVITVALSVRNPAP